LDGLTFLLKALEVLRWPVFFGVFIIFFRVPLSRLIDALRTATIQYKSEKTTLEAKLETVREVLGPTPLKPAPKKIEELARESPPKAVEVAWNDLYDRARASLSATGKMAPIDVAGLLSSRHILLENEAIAFYKLFELKDEVTKPGSPVATDTSSSAAYGTIAHTLAERISLPKKNDEGP